MAVPTSQFDLPPARANRQAFTLTEMLVAVGLLMVIMLIFAQIFQLAVTAMSNQKGLANNNQRARTVFSVIDADLKRMSYRSTYRGDGIVPLVPGILYNGEEAAPEQQGYIFYSENDPSDNTDDVLQFTVDANNVGAFPGSQRYGGQPAIPFFGRAFNIAESASLTAGFNLDGDQPDLDDGSAGNGVSESTKAEVVYFLRHGTLYRRVLMLREPGPLPFPMRDEDGANLKKLGQPGYADPAGGVAVTDFMTDYGGNFYSDFDFSAHFGESPYNAGTNVALFHHSLSNTSTNNWPLGVPHFRFGFSNATGLPREFVTDGAMNDYFFGRYTHEETSNTSFQYPHNTSGNVFGGTFNVNNARSTGRLNRFTGGTRRGEDILMTNVFAFDVEIWDAAFGDFIDINDASAIDFDTDSVLLNGSYGSSGRSSGNWQNVFDTWHSYPEPDVMIDANTPWPSEIGNGEPPFVPKLVNSTNAASQGYNWRGEWSAFVGPVDPTMDDRYRVGDVVLPTATFIGANPEFSRMDEAVLYLCVQEGIQSDMASGEPTWPRDVVSGQFVTQNDSTLTNPPVWVPLDNRKPIRAIRITILFLDPTSDQTRQVTMVHSFNEFSN